MSSQCFFEIDHAIFRGPKLKSGGSYRLLIGWETPDSATQKEIVTQRAKPSGNGANIECVWANPSGGKRSCLNQGPAPPGSHCLEGCLPDVMLNVGMDTQLVITAAIAGNAVTQPHSLATVPTGDVSTTASLPMKDPSETNYSMLLPAEAADAVKEVATLVSAKKPNLVMEMGDQLIAPMTCISTTASTNSDGFPTLLNTLVHFMKIGGIVSEIHPIAAVAWSVVNIAYQIIQASNALDQNVQSLIMDMDDTCQLVTHYEHNHKDLQAAAQAVLHEVVKGAHVLKAYGKVYNQSAVALNELAKIHQGIEHLVAQEYFRELQYAEVADSAYRRHAPDSGCLPGTRNEILNTLVSWISGGSQLPSPPPYLTTVLPDKHILWLCGVAGSGKSSVALSVANSLGKLPPSLHTSTAAC
ncbi:hypothetical protein DL93DRAFT_2161126 [Clavulina sp. PMI_390]|nr:hypothetical protein DL93DRAFT_2161126 [Clavulina sp. PMI_390]